MGACDTWNVEIKFLVYENEMFSLPAEFHFNKTYLKFLSSYFFVEPLKVLQRS